MTDDAPELRCVDCSGVFIDGKTFHIIGGVNISPHTTVEDEIHNEFDAGNLCKACYGYRITQLQQKSSRL